ncbi:MAG: hypothetical protein ACKPKO_10160 [Candidatus Fonsibacter sp.]
MFGNTPPCIKLATNKFIDESAYTNSLIVYNANYSSNIFSKFE